MFLSKKLLTASLLAFMLGTAASLPAQAAYEYEEPKSDAERIQLIDRLIVEKEWRDALKYIALALEDNPSNVQLKFKRAVIYSRMGDKPSAKRYFNEMIRDYPEIVEPYNNLGDLALQGKRPDVKKALQYYEKALSLTPNDKPLSRKIRALKKRLEEN